MAVVEATEIRKLAALEDTHWWYRERRALLARSLRAVGQPGEALDVGAAAGGNTRVLRRFGWRPVALEYSQSGAEVAKARGLDVIRGDARLLPVRSRSVDLVVAFDILEHISDDVRAAGEMLRVLRPGRSALVAVPADPRLWSAHDVAVEHVRRYTRTGLVETVTKAGFLIDELWSWNVLLRPVASWRRKRSSGSDLDRMHPVVNFGLSAVIAAERYLPVKALPGVSLMVRMHRPS